MDGQYSGSNCRAGSSPEPTLSKSLMIGQNKTISNDNFLKPKRIFYVLNKNIWDSANEETIKTIKYLFN